MATQPATDAGRRGGPAAAALEAVRASVLALHAAVGLTLPVSRQAARLVRAAEGLSRSAVAVLSAPPAVPRAASPSAPAADAGGLPRRHRRRRGVRSGGGMEVDVGVPDAAVDELSKVRADVGEAGAQRSDQGVAALPHPVFVAAAGSARGVLPDRPLADGSSPLGPAAALPAPAVLPPEADNPVRALLVRRALGFGVPPAAVGTVERSVYKLRGNWQPLACHKVAPDYTEQLNDFGLRLRCLFRGPPAEPAT